ncbi:lysozyme inhibitor [bacterium]|nr:lysozyme inhibitor [bacterium]
MKKIFGFILGLVVLGGCDQANDAPATRQCGPYAVDMTFADDGATLMAHINGDAVTLHGVVSASGARYNGTLNNTDVTLWGKGDAWTLILGDQELFECR